MAKRDTGRKRASEDAIAATPTTVDAIEQRVVVFAEQLGRIAGTVQARAEGWMDREALGQQIASVRDGAVNLLKHLTPGAAKASKKARAAPRGKAKARSGGVVDAPGKKHRKQMPADPDATVARSQAAKVRAAKTMEKTSRRRGRA